MEWKRVISNIQQNNNHHTSLTNEENQKAQMSQQAYKNENERSNIGSYQYKKEHSGKDWAVYSDPKANKHILSFKGTSNSKDIVPDLNIVAGTQNNSSSFEHASNLLKDLKQKINGTWETTGHSLGGTKAMWAAQQNNVDSHAFNPGYNSVSDDQIKTDRKGNHVYVVKGDAISNSILGTKLHKVKTFQSRNKFNPLTSHSISAFTSLPVS